MKNIKYQILLLLFLAAALNTRAQFISAEMQVSGLTCSMCSFATEKAVRTLDFVQDVKPDLNHAYFNITFKPGARVSMDEIAKKVQQAGFSISKLTATFAFNGIKTQDAHFEYQGSLYHFISDENKATGQVKLTFWDKDFVPAKEYKRILKQEKMECYKTGHSTACCPMEKTNNVRVYHVTI